MLGAPAVKNFGQNGAGKSGGASGANSSGAGGGPAGCFYCGGGGGGWAAAGLGAASLYDGGGGGSYPSFSGGSGPGPMSGAGGFGGGGGDGGGARRRRRWRLFGRRGWILGQWRQLRRRRRRRIVRQTLLDVTVAKAGENGTSQLLRPSNGYVTINGSIFAYAGAVVDYTIPTSGAYDIIAYGAQGGASSIVGGGYGAEYGGDIALLKGTLLGIVAGGAGGDSGGGGGSFVWIASEPKSAPTPIPELSTSALTALGFAGLGVIGPWASRLSRLRRVGWRAAEKCPHRIAGKSKSVVKVAVLPAPQRG